MILLTNRISLHVWKIPPLSYIDFPWRLLTPLAFLLSLLTAFLALHRVTRIIVTVFAVLTVILSLQFARPNGAIEKPDEYYATNDATTTSMDELMPLWVREKPTNRPAEKIIGEGVAVSDIIYNSR